VGKSLFSKSSRVWHDMSERGEREKLEARQRGLFGRGGLEYSLQKERHNES